LEPLEYDPMNHRFKGITVGNYGTRQEKIKETTKQSILQPRVPNRPRADESVRLDDGKKAELGIGKFTESGNRRKARAHLKQIETLYGNNPDYLTLQSRFQSNAKGWFGAVYRGQRELERVRQGEATESPFLTKNGQFTVHMSGRLPIITEPQDYDIQGVGKEIWDAINERRRCARVSDGTFEATRRIVKELEGRTGRNLSKLVPEDWYYFPERYLPIETLINEVANEHSSR
jgi:hypothetical protein